MLKTVQGEPLTVEGSGKNLMVTDEKGGSARITIADVYQSNGVIQGRRQGVDAELTRQRRAGGG